MSKAKQAQTRAGTGEASATVSAGKRPPVVYSKKIKAEWLKDDKFSSTISQFPKRFREVLTFGATVARSHTSNHSFFFFEVRLDVDGNGKSIPSIEVFDEIRILLYPSRNKRKSSLLAWTDDPLARLARDFIEAFNTSQDSGKESILHAILIETGHGEPTVKAAPEMALPVAAPTLWLDRTNRDQAPPEFLRDTYRQWLGKGLQRAHLLRLDPPLYKALANWLRSHAMPDDLAPHLLTKKEINLTQVQEYRTRQSAEGMSAREYLRLRSVAAREKAREPQPS